MPMRRRRSSSERWSRRHGGSHKQAHAIREMSEGTREGRDESSVPGVVGEMNSNAGPQRRHAPADRRQYDADEHDRADQRQRGRAQPFHEQPTRNMEQTKRDAGGQGGWPKAGAACPQSPQSESSEHELLEDGRDDVGVHRPITSDRLLWRPDAADFRPESLNSEPGERDEQSLREALRGSQPGCGAQGFARAAEKPDCRTDPHGELRNGPVEPGAPRTHTPAPGSKHRLVNSPSDRPQREAARRPEHEPFPAPPFPAVLTMQMRRRSSLPTARRGPPRPTLVLAGEEELVGLVVGLEVDVPRVVLQAPRAGLGAVAFVGFGEIVLLAGELASQ